MAKEATRAGIIVPMVQHPRKRYHVAFDTQGGEPIRRPEFDAVSVPIAGCALYDLRAVEDQDSQAWVSLREESGKRTEPAARINELLVSSKAVYGGNLSVIVQGVVHQPAMVGVHACWVGRDLSEDVRRKPAGCRSECLGKRFPHSGKEPAGFPCRACERPRMGVPPTGAATGQPPRCTVRGFASSAADARSLAAGTGIGSETLQRFRARYNGVAGGCMTRMGP